MKRIIVAAILAVVCLAVAGGAAAGVVVYANQPKNVVVNSLADVFEGLSQRDEIAPIIDMLTKGSLEVTLSDKSSDSNKEFSGKAYFSKNAIMFDDIFIKSGELEIDAQMYISEEYIYVNSEEILGEAYGIIVGDLADEFKDSIFAPDAKSEYSIGEEEFDDVMKLLESIDNDDAKKISKDFERHTEKYTKFLTKTFFKYAECKSETDRVKVGGERIDARVITVIVDEEAVIETLSDLCDEIQSDEKLREDIIDLIEKYYDETWASMGIKSEDRDDIEDWYDDMLDEFENSVDDMEDDISEDELIVELVTPKMSSKLLQLTATTKENGSKEELFTLDLGPKGIKETDRIEFTADNASVIYEIKDNSKDEYSAVLEYIPYKRADTETVFKVKVNKQKDTFKLEIPEEELVIKGDFITKSGTTTITLGEVLYSGDVTDMAVEVTVVISRKDKMPKALSKNEVTGIFEITEEDIERITENLRKLEGFDSEGFGATEYPEKASDAVLYLRDKGYEVSLDPSSLVGTIGLSGFDGVSSVVAGQKYGTFYMESSVILVYFESKSYAEDAWSRINILTEMFYDDEAQNKADWFCQRSGNLICFGNK